MQCERQSWPIGSASPFFVLLVFSPCLDFDGSFSNIEHPSGHRQVSTEGRVTSCHVEAASEPGAAADGFGQRANLGESERKASDRKGKKKRLEGGRGTWIDRRGSSGWHWGPPLGMLAVSKLEVEKGAAWLS